MNTAQLIVPGDHATGTLRIAVVAYLARFKGQSRVHTDSDLRSFLDWCRRQGLDPLAAQRPHVELFLRWMQEVGRYKPLTVSRRLSVVAGFYRTCVIDGLLEHSPAEYGHRPRVSTESPTLGLSHLQLEALLTAGRKSSNINDFALEVPPVGAGACGRVGDPEQAQASVEEEVFYAAFLPRGACACSAILCHRTALGPVRRADPRTRRHPSAGLPQPTHR